MIVVDEEMICHFWSLHVTENMTLVWTNVEEKVQIEAFVANITLQKEI